MKRGVVRFSRNDLDGLGQIVDRYFHETRRKLTRAGLVRMFVAAGLATIDKTRPLAEQLPLHLLAPERRLSRPRQAHEGTTLRKRVLDTAKAHGAEVLTPAGVAHLLGDKRSDAVRNALLALAEQGQIEKLGPGQYRAYRHDPRKTEARSTQGDAARI